jgi:hypothetical protein
MSPTLERVYEEIELLPTSEQYDLYATLRSRFEPEPDEDTQAVEEAWDAEIANRVADIKAGRVQLISGDVAEQQMNDFIANLRRTKAAAGL